MMEDFNTGEYTNTGGRLLRVKEYIKDTFLHDLRRWLIKC